jgi:predicted transposase/invertase (TIGR01784 family)
MNNRTLISFDWALKHILRDKANFCILEGFLSELLQEDITIIDLLESESNQSSDEDKYNRVDMLVKTGKNEKILIEVQNDPEIDYFQRMSYGTAKVIAEHLKLGEAYGAIKRVISVNVVYFNLGSGKDYIYRGITSFEGLHHRDLLELSESQQEAFERGRISDFFPEYYLIKLRNFHDVTRDRLDEWIYFLRNSEIRPEFQARGLAEAQQRLQVLKMSPQELATYQGFIKARRIAAGVSEGQYFQGGFDARQELLPLIQKAEADKQKAEADKQKAEADKQKAIDHLQTALTSLIDSGMSEPQARHLLGL